MVHSTASSDTHKGARWRLYTSPTQIQPSRKRSYSTDTCLRLTPGSTYTINEVAPLDVDALIFGGDNDVFIFGVEELEGVYQEPTIIISSTANHHLPSSDDETYGDVLAFFRQGTNGTL